MAAEVTPEISVVHRLDCRGLACPLPVIKTKQAVDKMAVGHVLEMIATDPGAKPDMVAWSKSTGHVLVDTREEPGVYTFYIRKAG
ncbi:MAG: sulfurtransferase TusA family protein [Betaproteobacteria bacterium]|nr:sulfurtransferase TusA family protein [Betaproteobacteria bacterium]